MDKRGLAILMRLHDRPNDQEAHDIAHEYLVEQGVTKPDGTMPCCKGKVKA